MFPAPCSAAAISRRLVWSTLILTLFGWGKPCAAQTAGETPPSGGILQARLPTVPLKQPRPAQGAAANQQWQTARTGEEGAPVASFIDTLKANDAAFEVILGQGRLLTTKVDIATGEGTAVIAVGDPTVIDFQVLPNPRMIRVIGKRAGVTDFSITTADGQVYGFEVHVVYDLQLLRAQLKQVFPDAHLKLAQLREHLVVEGQARSPAQVSQILQAIESFLESVQVRPAGGGGRFSTQASSRPGRPAGGPAGSQSPPKKASGEQAQQQRVTQAGPETGAIAPSGGTAARPRVINLIRVPGVQQVMLQVRIAELNRTGVRELGADILGVDPDSGNIFGTNIAGATVDALATLGLGGLVGAANTANGPSGTVFGIIPGADFEILLRALRRNSLLNILAEPNLMALSGQEASFLAGGQFPVPVPQAGGGVANMITIEWKDFGVQLRFVPYVVEDELIRLQVEPEVSTIDDSLGVAVLGTQVPGVNSRKARTTVELRQGQTLAIAGLLQVTLDGQTSRIPGLGDLPYIGPLFSNTSHERVEKELLVLVTPYLVQPMNPDQVPPLPGEEVQDPSDLEFYLLNRIEGRTGRNHRSTTSWDDPMGLRHLLKLERRHVCGPVGFSQ